MEPQFLSSQNHRFTTSQMREITKKINYFDGWYRYLGRTQSYPATRFIFEMTVFAWFLKIAIALPVGLTLLLIYGDPAVWQNPQEAAFAARPVSNAILALIAAPLFETIIGQWAPLAIVKQLTPRSLPALAVATFFFAGLHLLSWNFIIFVATIPIGFVLAWSFLIWQRQSLMHAIGVTAAVHALHNAIALALMFS